MKKSDVPEFKNMLIRNTMQLHTAMKDEDFAEAAFLYEMDNHEYAINWDGDEDVMSCFTIYEDDIIKMNLERGYLRMGSFIFKGANAM